VVISWKQRQARPGVHSYGDYGIVAIKLVNNIKLNVSNDMYRNYLDKHICMVDIFVNDEHPLMYNLV